MTPTTPATSLKQYGQFLLLALLWSGSFINIKVVVDVLPPVFCAMMRVLISLLTLILFFSIAGKPIFARVQGMWRLWLAGLFTQSFPFALLFYGEKFIAPSLASIINSTVSLWALFLGACLFRDTTQWTPIKITGLFLGFLGIVFIFSPTMHQGENSMIGIIAIMGMAIAYAIGGLINQHVIFAKMQVPFEMNLLQQHVSSLGFLLLCSLSLETWPTWAMLLNTHLILSFLYLGVVATAIAWMLYFDLLKRWGAVSTATVMYIVPVLAITWDLLFLHIVPTATELIGATAILVGVILIQWVRPIKNYE